MRCRSLKWKQWEKMAITPRYSAEMLDRELFNFSSH